MIEIIPNWHPIFTHFTIGLLLTGSALFLVGYLFRRNNTGMRITTAARWNLAIGAVFAVVTIATGYQAYYSVAHDAPSHAAMTIHLKWAWTAFVLFSIAAVLAWFDRKRFAGAGIVLSIVLVAAASTLAVTGYLGGENVYRHGIGVMRLPESSGPGHNHSHEGAEAHDHGDATTGGTAGTVEEQDDDDHDHDHDDNTNSSSADDGHSHDQADVAGASQSAESPHVHAKPATPEAVLGAFHHALEEGNGQAALQWLADDVVILEGGVAQSKEEYAGHHLGSDMAFLAAMQFERLSRETRQADGVVTVITRTQVKGTFKDQDIDVVSSETAVLKQVDGDWRIQHLHWSN